MSGLRQDPKTLEQAIEWIKKRDKVTDFLRGELESARAEIRTLKMTLAETSATGAILALHNQMFERRLLVKGHCPGHDSDASIKSFLDCIARHWTPLDEDKRR